MNKNLGNIRRDSKSISAVLIGLPWTYPRQPFYSSVIFMLSFGVSLTDACSRRKIALIEEIC